VDHHAQGVHDFGPLLVNNLDDNNNEFHIRGETSFVLMEMIQQSLITQLGRANFLLACRMEGEEDMYVLIRTLFLRTGHSSSKLLGCSTSLLPRPEAMSMAATLFAEVPGLTKTHMEKIVRRISARAAGVVKLKNDIHTILAILIPVCHQSVIRHQLHPNYYMDNENEMETDNLINKKWLFIPMNAFVTWQCLFRCLVVLFLLQSLPSISIISIIAPSTRGGRPQFRLLSHLKSMQELQEAVCRARRQQPALRCI
jgi:hypothetical protein